MVTKLQNHDWEEVKVRFYCHARRHGYSGGERGLTVDYARTVLSEGRLGSGSIQSMHVQHSQRADCMLDRYATGRCGLNQCGARGI